MRPASPPAVISPMGVSTPESSSSMASTALRKRSAAVAKPDAGAVARRPASMRSSPVSFFATITRFPYVCVARSWTSHPAHGVGLRMSSAVTASHTGRAAATVWWAWSLSALMRSP